MAKEKDLSPKKSLKEDQDPDEIIVRKNEEVEDYSEDLKAEENQPKKRISNASVPVEQFDWDAFEKETVYDTPKDVIEDQYLQTLNKVIEDTGPL